LRRCELIAPRLVVAASRVEIFVAALSAHKSPSREDEAQRSQTPPALSGCCQELSRRQLMQVMFEAFHNASIFAFVELEFATIRQARTSIE
jgi:hypothetical protein